MRGARRRRRHARGWRRECGRWPVDALDGPDAVLGSLDPEQREVALVSRGPVCVRAGAGTGKTRAVAHRIAYSAATGTTDPARVLAVTFTTRAAGEPRGRPGPVAGPDVPLRGPAAAHALLAGSGRRPGAAGHRLQDPARRRGGPAAAAVGGP